MESLSLPTIFGTVIDEDSQMVLRNLAAGVWVVMSSLTAQPVWSDDVDDYLATANPQELFEQVCSTCHNLNLPKSQRLDRPTWEWVVGDMVENGCKFVDRRVKDRIVDYLVENYGPSRPR